jgi:membrane protein implicated in regulation of membrane protease activity
MDWLSTVEYWHWLVLGVVLVILEVLSPAAFFLWLAISAGIVGILLLANPDMAWEYQILAFALFSVVSIAVWRMYLKRHPIETDQPTLNRRGEQYVGRLFSLEQAVVNGHGKIRVDDSTWKIEGPDCESGTRVRIIGVAGVVLKFEMA